LQGLLGKQTIAIVSAVKGLELTTSKRMSGVVAEYVGDLPICSLSGPNLAGEILAGLPAASVVACKDAAVAATVQRMLSVANFRVYSNEDLIGVELGGTLKNVIAIAAGASDGLKLGCNAKSALLTRGLAEMTRLAVRMGAKPITLAGLAGMGDLVATCAGPASRNYRLGMELAQGKPQAEILQNLGAIAEGVTTAEAVCELSKQLGLELPIAEQVNATLKGKSTPKGAIMTLMGRPPSSEY
jgi:glycerol-3-phosphate dehydrogenase (NAD(P)+)